VNGDFAMRSWESQVFPKNDVWERAAASVETEFTRLETAFLPDEPTVSVVVPFYGTDESTLIKCVESLLNQDYAKDRLAIIVVDNNQTERLSPYLFSGCCKIVHEPLPGAYAARNRGISESSGDIVAFTDSDCVAQRSWISAGVRTLKQATKPVIVGGPIKFAFNSKTTKSGCELLDSIIHHRQNEYIFKHGFAATANLFVPRVLISNRGQFDARFLAGGDREFGQRLTADGVGIIMAGDAVIMHPARKRFGDLLQKALRGVGGERTSLSLTKSSPWAIFKFQIENYLHRQRLISNQAGSLKLGFYQVMKLRVLLTLIYVARLLEALRLVLGGRPVR
jgi:glycosyltransferase involved in cell wall biosynthesis